MILCADANLEVLGWKAQTNGFEHQIQQSKQEVMCCPTSLLIVSVSLELVTQVYC